MTRHCTQARNLHCEFARTKLTASCFRIGGPKFWNTIPLETRNTTSLFTFKSRVKFFLLFCSQCHSDVTLLCAGVIFVCVCAHDSSRTYIYNIRVCK